MAAAQKNNDTTMCIILYAILPHSRTLCTRTLLMSPYKCEMHLREKSRRRSDVTRVCRLREVDRDTSGELSAKWTSITDFPGRGFHGLRYRSLWWSGTRSLYGRPTYLAFVNNLYFTNDVLHPSATYQGIALSYARMHVTKVCFRLAFRAHMSTRSHIGWHEGKRRMLMIDAT